MIVLFGSIIFLLLLLLMKEAYRPLHALLTVILFFILFQYVLREQLLPLFKTLFSITANVPYGRSLLFSAVLLIIGQLLVALLVEQEYEAIAEVVRLAVRLTLITFWLMQLTPAFKELQTLLERLQ
ncbi:MAG: pyruvate formate-lyase [Solibacillus sp.]